MLMFYLLMGGREYPWVKLKTAKFIYFEFLNFKSYLESGN